MRSNISRTQLEDLLHLRAQQDRIVTEHVLLKNWDAAAVQAGVSDRITQAIHRHIREHHEDLYGLPDVAQEATG
jgi:hypothetical protein